MIAQIEYVGFETRGPFRQYTLVVKRVGADPRSFVLAIPAEAFVAHRLRYQDAPEICFLKLQRAIAACTDDLPEPHLDVTDAELLDYRESHTGKPPQKRARPRPVPAP